MRYVGQGYELRVPVAQTAGGSWNWEQAWRSFHENHKTEYGHAFPGSPIEVTTVRVIGKGMMPQLPGSLTLRAGITAWDARLKQGETYFRVNGTMRKLCTEFYDRAALPPGAIIPGPAVLFQKDSTTVIPPFWVATVDDTFNVVVRRDTCETTP